MQVFQPPTLFCPFEPALHPALKEIEEEALGRWAKLLGLHARHKGFKKLQQSHFPVLLGRCHPTASKERMAAALDFLIWNFSWDDQIDVGDVPPEWVRQQNAMALAVLQGAIPYHDAPPLLWLLTSIRERMVRLMPAAWMERFIQACQAYFRGTEWEAETRRSRICHDVDTYIQLRRLSVGTYMVFVQIEAIEGFFLPDEILSNPDIERLVETATDVIAWANDLFSLSQDLQDDFHPNLVFSLQKQHGLSLQEAIQEAVRMHDEAVLRFLELERRLPSFGQMSGQVESFLAGIRRWIRANVDWSIMTGRYQEPLPAREPAAERELRVA
jgi:hypothetical protein